MFFDYIFPFIFSFFIVNNFILIPDVNNYKYTHRGGVCMLGNCNIRLALKKCNGSTGWSIHGLWLDYANGSYPEYCSNMTFWNITNSSLEAKMRQEWYSCEGDEIDFWNHELQKHGSCIKDYIFPLMNSNGYFEDTIELYNGLKPVIPYVCRNKTDNCYISFN